MFLIGRKRKNEELYNEEQIQETEAKYFIIEVCIYIVFFILAMASKFEFKILVIFETLIVHTLP